MDDVRPADQSAFNCQDLDARVERRRVQGGDPSGAARAQFYLFAEIFDRAQQVDYLLSYQWPVEVQREKGLLVAAQHRFLVVHTQAAELQAILLPAGPERHRGRQLSV